MQNPPCMLIGVRKKCSSELGAGALPGSVTLLPGSARHRRVAVGVAPVAPPRERGRSTPPALGPASSPGAERAWSSGSLHGIIGANNKIEACPFNS